MHLLLPLLLHLDILDLSCDISRSSCIFRSLVASLDPVVASLHPAIASLDPVVTCLDPVVHQISFKALTINRHSIQNKNILFRVLTIYHRSTRYIDLLEQGADPCKSLGPPTHLHQNQLQVLLQDLHL